MTKLITRRQAKAMLDAKPHLQAERYSAGKFAWLGSEKAMMEALDIERENVPQSVEALYIVRGQDAYGAYARVMCITARTPVEAVQ